MFCIRVVLTFSIHLRILCIMTVENTRTWVNFESTILTIFLNKISIIKSYLYSRRVSSKKYIVQGGSRPNYFGQRVFRPILFGQGFSANLNNKIYIIPYNSPSSLRVSVGGLYKLDNCSVRLYNLYNKSVLWVFSVHTKKSLYYYFYLFTTQWE